jgi:hypothetical protein
MELANRRKYYPAFVQLLETARAMIDCGDEDYICNAIEFAKPKEDPTHLFKHAAWALKDRVCLEIDGCTTLGLYLGLKYDVVLDKHEERLCRLAWIDKMIEQYRNPEA